MQLEYSRRFFEKSSNIKFLKNPYSGSWVVLCGRTDTTKFIVAFRNFANAPINWSCSKDFCGNFLQRFSLRVTLFTVCTCYGCFFISLDFIVVRIITGLDGGTKRLACQTLYRLCLLYRFVICTYQMLLSWQNQGGWDGLHVWGDRKKNVYICSFVIDNPEGNRPLKRPGRRWKFNIKMYLKGNVWRCSTDKSGCGKGLGASFYETVIDIRFS